MKSVWRPFLLTTALLVFVSSQAFAATWTNLLGGTQTWNVAANWDTNPVFPNGIDVVANIPSTQPSNRTIDFGANQALTLGTLNIDNATSFFNQFGTANQGQSLTFDVTAGNATINVTGHTTTTNANGQSIRVPIVLNDNLVVNADWVKNDYSAIALNFLAGSFTGSGNLTKNGLGTLSFADVDKAFTGTLTVNQGRLRTNNAATMSGVSSVLVNDGAALVAEKNGDITWGNPATTVVTLNGLGTISPPAGFGFHFPGAIRTGTNLNQIINNNIVLASTAAINQVGSSGSLSLNGVLSGPGTFVSGALVSDPTNQGQIILNVANTYTGGTIIQLGQLTVTGGATVGTGSVMVDGASVQVANQGPSEAAGRLYIQGANAIADNAFLNITGGGADTLGGTVQLEGGVNEVVGGLMVAGQILGPGTYGSLTSSQSPANTGLANPDLYFLGDGIITVSATACGGGVCVPGDYNANGVVDAPDYVVWRKGGTLFNDFTPGVQPSDYDFWRSRMGATTNPGSGLTPASVPEASTLSLAALLAVLLGSYRRVGHNTRG
jgi:autotransporter-associated beta strand protein